MCCACRSKGNTIQEAVKYQHGKVELVMLTFMDDIADDIAAVAAADNIRKEYRIVERWRLKIK